ncbi:MAG TPA: DUF4038 domain-containing protein, partial [Opitutus sp.]|nr:DUF4038 domain-containing protein [Opitutus sp.]
MAQRPAFALFVVQHVVRLFPVAVFILAARAAEVFPLHVAPGHRYLVGADGRPWRIQAEFAWALPTKASAQDLDVYLADRKAKGFDAFVTMAMMRPGGTYRWPAANVNGDAAFLQPDDFSTPNDRFFDHVDLVIDKAAAQGFAVLMFYAYAGYNGGNEGWYEVIAQPPNTKEVCYGFGRYLARRWKEKANLILMAGGDYTMPAGETRDRMHEILRGLRDGGCAQLAGSEWTGPDSLVTAQAGFTYGPDPRTSDLQLNSFYGLGPAFTGLVFDTADRAWRNQPVLPAYIEEPMQGYASYAPIDARRASIRRHQHWAVLAGAIAGSNWGMFEFANSFTEGDWQRQLNDVMAEDQGRALHFYQSIPWWLLQPSGT